MNLKIIYSFMIILALLFSLTAKASVNVFENLTSLKINAELFIKNNDLESPYPINIDIKPISKKLKLKKCGHPLDFEFNNLHKKSGHTLIKVSCHAPVKWRMNLPVTITLYQDVLVLKHPVIRSQSIDEEDVIVKKMNAKYLVRGYYTQIDQLRQLETRRDLKASTILSPSNLKAKLLIKSGQQVTLQLNYSGLAIKVSATALHSASKGQLIKVRNNNSLKIVEGIVKSAGVVQVNL